MQVDTSEIYFSSEDRARKDYGNVESLLRSLSIHGQLQPVLVREFSSAEWPGADKEYDYVLVDGGRRFAAIRIAHRKEVEIPDLPHGKIEAVTKENVSEVDALVLEYEANEERKDFDWREKALFIRRIHEAMVEQDEDWVHQQTAEVLNTTEVTVTRYLQLTSDPDIFKANKVAEADTFRTAHKQWQILRDKKRREKIVQHRDRLEELKDEGVLEDVDESDLEELRSKGAETSEADGEPSVPSVDIVTHADCRHWFTEVPDEYFDWVHWDPPYGGEQSGGAFTSFKEIADDWMTASQLMRESIPEIYRILRDGHWLAIWCHPTRTNWLARYLRGHVKDEHGQCEFCGRPWEVDNLTSVCEANPQWHFWVNPYPCIWYKKDRASDGHEIRRFLTNQYETFLLAAKVGENDNPILPRSDMGNVFPHVQIPRSSRRHVMHKPDGLLRQIISLISVPGSLGCDPSAGSGSIIEAAIRTGRKIRACEADEEYAETCVNVAKKTVKSVAMEGVQYAD